MRWRSSKPVHRPPGFVEPCLPTLGSAVPSGPKWAYEIKHDGFRFICRREGDRVRVFSRGGYDWTDRVPLIAKALAALRVKSVTLDGEGVVCREDGVSDFDRLRAAVGRLGSRDAFLYAFDLLEINGDDLRPYEWQVRRATLASLLRKADKGIRLSEHIDGADGAAIFGHACAMGQCSCFENRQRAPGRQLIVGHPCVCCRTLSPRREGECRSSATGMTCDGEAKGARRPRNDTREHAHARRAAGLILHLSQLSVSLQVFGPQVRTSRDLRPVQPAQTFCAGIDGVEVE
jgi:bifunctional non-homologous end joining protein LigD